MLDGSLELGKLGRLSDDKVIAGWSRSSGLGRWSADMFLMFHLQRPDVLPVGDLGIRQALHAVYGLPELPEAAEMERDRRAVAPLPVAGLAVPVAVARAPSPCEARGPARLNCEKRG